MQFSNDFNPIAEYPAYEGMKEVNLNLTKIKIGEIGNLILAMVDKDATTDELNRAIRHSMVLLNSVKFQLDDKQSCIDHGIKDLINKYNPPVTEGVDVDRIMDILEPLKA